MSGRDATLSRRVGSISPSRYTLAEAGRGGWSDATYSAPMEVRYTAAGVTSGSRYEKALAQLEEFASLRSGWLDLEGDPAKQSALRSARSGMQSLALQAIREPSLMMLDDGRIAADWLVGRWSLGLIFDLDNEVELQMVHLDTFEQDDWAVALRELPRRVEAALARAAS